MAENIVVLSGGSLASNADLRKSEDGNWEIQGDPTEAAFLVAEHKLGAAERRKQRFERISEIPFTSERKIMSTIEIDHEHGDEIVVITKGAPDVLLGRCTRARVGADPETDDVMARKPRLLTERVIDARMWAGVLQIGAVMAVVTLLTIDMYLPGGLTEGNRDLANARTAGFTVLVFAQLYNCFNARSDTASAFHHLFVNGWLWAAVALSLALQVAVVHLGFLNLAFDTVPLGLDQWLACAAMASIMLWFSELRKLAARAMS